ncbi:hypothetical protein HanIR_Chr09g0397301 [Helianthus annuus]|nr:hypothetical protein HanIR_Chr09g0397301 [Helianthus annuus]
MGFDASLQMKRLAFIPTHGYKSLLLITTKTTSNLIILLRHSHPPPLRHHNRCHGRHSGMDALHILEFSFNFNRLSKSVFIAAVTSTQSSSNCLRGKVKQVNDQISVVCKGGDDGSVHEDGGCSTSSIQNT